MQLSPLSALGAIALALLGVTAFGVPSAAVTSTATVTVSPSKTLHDKQVVTVKGSGFESDHAIYVGQCNANVVNDLSAADCDATTVVTGRTSKTGTFTIKFAVTDGKDYADNGHGRCDSKDPCVVGAIDSVTSAPTKYGFQTVTFAPMIASRISVKAAAKSGAVGSTDKLSLQASAAKSNGSFAGSAKITDDGKKVGTAKLSPKGKATYPLKLKTTGKQKIVVSYAGNGNYKKSTSKPVTVTVH